MLLRSGCWMLALVLFFAGVPVAVTANEEAAGNRRDRTVQLANRSWLIVVEEFFESEADLVWSYARCHVAASTRSEIASFPLATRPDRISVPRGPLLPGEEYRPLGVDYVDLLTLISQCPWSDQEFKVSEIQPSPITMEMYNEVRFELKGRELFYKGPINAEFLDELKTYDFETLVISSLGGKIAPAMLAGIWLRENGKSVRVTSICQSACALVFSGGVTRTVDGGTIGVHRFSRDHRSATSFGEAQQLVSDILVYMQAMGIDVKLLHLIADTPSTEMRYLNRAELVRYGLLQEKTSDAKTAIQNSRFVRVDWATVDDRPINEQVVVNVDACAEVCVSSRSCRAYVYHESNGMCSQFSAFHRIRSAWRTVMGMRLEAH